jgi:tetratricopeptide (TPR) repeat protein
MAAAIRHLELAMTYSDDDRSYGSAQNNLANALVTIGDYDGAIAHALEAVRRHRSIGYERGLAYALDTAGFAYMHNSDFEHAITYLAQSAQMCRELELGAAEVPTLISLGQAYQAAGRLEEARATWQRALAVADRQGPSLHFDRDEIVRLLESTCRAIHEVG